MEYGTLPGLDKPMSRIIQGVMAIGRKDDTGQAVMDEAFGLGVTAFDTARIYGGGEADRFLGRWMTSRAVRGKTVVIAKGAHPNADRKRVTPYDIASDLHDSLAAMRTDYIDLYMLHRDDPDVPAGEIIDALDEHVRAGLIRAVTASNWTPARLEQANDYAARHGRAPFVAGSVHVSLAEQAQPPWADCLSIAGPGGARDRRWYAEHHMPVLAWSSLCGGLFSGRMTSRELAELPDDPTDILVRSYRTPGNLRRLDRAWELATRKGVPLPQIVLAWVLRLPLDVYPIVGSGSPEEVRVNVGTLSLRLSDRQAAWLDLAADRPE